MTDNQKRQEIITLLTFLQTFIQNNVDQSFTDLTFSLETVIMDYLNVFEMDTEKYENLNSLKHNYPAIDLVNKKKDRVVQITTNANLRKVKKTLETYEKHKLTFSDLIVIGFINATKSKMPNVTVYGIEYLTSLAKHASSVELDNIYEVLKRQIPWNSLTPMDDKHCFEVVLDVIDRSAVRDYSLCEGDYDRMVDGLYEVKEVITTGKISGKPTRAKALSEYTDKIKLKLSEIEFDISSILQICNCNRNVRQSDFLCLTRLETDMIDNLKEKIMKAANALAIELKIDKKIVGSKR